MFDDAALYMDESLGFAEGVTLAGVAQTGIFDLAQETLLDDVISTTPAFTATTAALSGAASGQLLVRGGVTYKVRQVLQLPPDAAHTRLILARA
jgi:hypothetical protein